MAVHHCTMISCHVLFTQLRTGTPTMFFDRRRWTGKLQTNAMTSSNNNHMEIWRKPLKHTDIQSLWVETNDQFWWTALRSYNSPTQECIDWFGNDSGLRGSATEPTETTLQFFSYESKAVVWILTFVGGLFGHRRRFVAMFIAHLQPYDCEQHIRFSMVPRYGHNATTEIGSSKPSTWRAIGFLKVSFTKFRWICWINRPSTSGLAK